MYQRGWDTMYWAVDIHDTVLEGNYDQYEIPTTFLPFAKDTLQMLSRRKDCVLILYSCSHQWDINKYLNFFLDNGIHFKYVNSNPEVPDNKLSCFRDKFYFNILLEDKAGFDPYSDWEDIYYAMKNMPLLNGTQVAHK